MKVQQTSHWSRTCWWQGASRQHAQFPNLTGCRATEAAQMNTDEIKTLADAGSNKGGHGKLNFLLQGSHTAQTWETLYAEAIE